MTGKKAQINEQKQTKKHPQPKSDGAWGLTKTESPTKEHTLGAPGYSEKDKRGYGRRIVGWEIGRGQ